MADPISVTLYSPGAIPGIPGIHTPGDYLLDYEARTIDLIPPDAGTQGEMQSVGDGQTNQSITEQPIDNQPPA